MPTIIFHKRTAPAKNGAYVDVCATTGGPPIFNCYRFIPECSSGVGEDSIVEYQGLLTQALVLGQQCRRVIAGRPPEGPPLRRGFRQPMRRGDGEYCENCWAHVVSKHPHAVPVGEGERFDCLGCNMEFEMP
jgi:hypothetical protein